MRERLTDFLRAQPFVPFTIVMSDGGKHEIRHPEHAALTKHWLIVVDADDSDHTTNLYLLHITQLDPHVPAA